MAKERSEAVRRGEETYERFANSGKEFTLVDVRIALFEDLEDCRDEAYAALVDHVLKTVDRKRAAAGDDDDQMTFFDVGGVYRFGDLRRIAKRSATLDHALESLSIDEANFAAVARANERKRKEIDLLRPYWTEGVTKEEAVEAYWSENEQTEAA